MINVKSNVTLWFSWFWYSVSLTMLVITTKKRPSSTKLPRYQHLSASSKRDILEFERAVLHCKHSRTNERMNIYTYDQSINWICNHSWGDIKAIDNTQVENVYRNTYTYTHIHIHNTNQNLARHYIFHYMIFHYTLLPYTILHSTIQWSIYAYSYHPFVLN